MGRRQAPKRQAVICLCGWVGRRTLQRCACEHDMCICALYGECPKCGGKIRSTVAQRRRDMEAEAYYREHEAEILGGLPDSAWAPGPRPVELPRPTKVMPEGCVVCGQPGEVEPRFGYVVCAKHDNIPPAQIHQTTKASS